MADKWQKKGKYEQHIRLANKIFEDRLIYIVNILAFTTKQYFCL